jgi:hypothetical protein
MGLVTNLVAYKLGKSRGKRKERNSQSEAEDSRDPDCINYSMFCRQFGSCDGQKCEYEHE